MTVAKKKMTKPLADDKGMAGAAPGLVGTPAAKAAAAPGAMKAPAKTLVPANPEKKALVAARRTRLSKAFPRPLDKKFKKETLVRDRFTIPASEYAVLVAFKKRLAEQGFAVKKSELLRVGLRLLGEVDEDEVKARLQKLAALA